MHRSSSVKVFVTALSCIGLVHASAPSFVPVEKRACGETAARVCFGINGGTSQNINPDDIAYAAVYLRNIADENEGTPGAFFTMPPSGADCQEWQLPLEFGETVMSLAKHINPRLNTSVLYEDIAATIDGGRDPTPEQFAGSLLGACGGNGGMMGVKANASNPAYKTSGYIEGKGKMDGLLVKIVHAPV